MGLLDLDGDPLGLFQITYRGEHYVGSEKIIGDTSAP
jgi:hypothetical protein